MAAAIAFDTHAYFKKLTDVGVPEPQAEVQAQTMAELIEDRLATKKDLFEVEASLRRELKKLEIEQARNIKELELRLTLRLGTLMTIAVGAVAALVKIL